MILSCSSGLLTLPPSSLTQDILVYLDYCAIKMQNFYCFVCIFTLF